MKEPVVEYRVMNGAHQPAPKVIGLSPENPKMIVVLIQPGKGYEVPNTPESIAKLKSMNCDCSALSGLNNSDESFNDFGSFDSGSSSSSSSGDGVNWDDIAKWTVEILGKVDWKSLFHNEEQKTQDLLDKFRNENAFQLYPRQHEGGPWRSVGYGNLDTMTLDELRYFIEWRMPMWKKQMANKDWGDTKQRVIDRYNRVADTIKETAIRAYKAKAGCYTNSGIYDDLVQASNGSSTINPHSTTIRAFQENCVPPASNDKSGGVYTGGGSGSTGSGNSSPQTAGFGKTLGILALLGAAGGIYYQTQKDKKKKDKAPKGPNKPAQEVVL